LACSFASKKASCPWRARSDALCAICSPK
jgi:hypothetical protein